MAQALEERVSKLEGTLEQMNERLGRIESEIASLRQEMNNAIGGLRQEMSTAIGELRRDLTTNFRWTTGTVIVMWVTIICAILFA